MESAYHIRVVRRAYARLRYSSHANEVLRAPLRRLVVGVPRDGNPLVLFSLHDVGAHALRPARTLAPDPLLRAGTSLRAAPLSKSQR
jgi:hypothetical protein